MTGSRWRVLKPKATDQFGGGHAGRWIAAEVGGWAAEVFDTHAEALAYADEQSRTVTVTLPPATSRAVFDAGRGYTTYVNWDVHGWAWLESDGGIFAITDLEREALALHLLAHHYRKARA